MIQEAGLVIVVADDDELQLDEVGEFLRRKGHRVYTASDGATAIRLINEHRPRIAMIDVNMPGWDGIRVAQVALEHGDKLALILMSGDSEAIVRANQAHVCPFAVVEKPLPLNHIERFIDAVSSETP